MLDFSPLLIDVVQPAQKAEGAWKESAVLDDKRSNMINVGFI